MVIYAPHWRLPARVDVWKGLNFVQKPLKLGNLLSLFSNLLCFLSNNINISMVFLLLVSLLHTIDLIRTEFCWCLLLKVLFQ